MDFMNEMADLIDLIGEGTIESLQANKNKIDEIAIYSRESGIYKHSESKTKEFTKDMNALDCYRHMIIKVAKAPTQIHAIGATKMFMPMISEKLAMEK